MFPTLRDVPDFKISLGSFGFMSDYKLDINYPVR